MSKNGFKKFKKNDFSYEDEESYDTRSNYADKRKEKRVQRALKTKNIRDLIEEDDEYDDDLSYVRK
jgi:hypothetical protein